MPERNFYAPAVVRGWRHGKVSRVVILRIAYSDAVSMALYDTLPDSITINEAQLSMIHPDNIIEISRYTISNQESIPEESVKTAKQRCKELNKQETP